jgi:hypothetical protein
MCCLKTAVITFEGNTIGKMELLPEVCRDCCPIKFPIIKITPEDKNMQTIFMYSIVHCCDSYNTVHVDYHDKEYFRFKNYGVCCKFLAILLPCWFVPYPRFEIDFPKDCDATTKMLILSGTIHLNELRSIK